MLQRHRELLTNVLEEGALVLEDNMKVPAPAWWIYWRRYTVTLSTDDFDLCGTIWTFRVGSWNFVGAQLVI
jgi:hypothetical protein